MSRGDLIALIRGILEAEYQEELIVEHRTWDTLLKHPKANVQKELQRRGIEESKIDSCVLGIMDDGEEQIAVVSVNVGKPIDKMLIAADQERLLGVYEPPSLPDSPAPTLKRSKGSWASLERSRF